MKSYKSLTLFFKVMKENTRFDENLIITPPLSSLFDVDLLRKQEPRIAKKSHFSICLAQEQAGVGLM